MIPQSTPPLTLESAAVSIAGPRSVAVRADIIIMAFVQLAPIQYTLGLPGTKPW